MLRKFFKIEAYIEQLDEIICTISKHTIAIIMGYFVIRKRYFSYLKKYGIVRT